MERKVNEEKSNQHNQVGETTKDAYSSSGLQENTAAVVAYLGVFFSGIAFTVNERESEFVRFHALQSIIVFVPLLILMMVFQYVPNGWLVQVCIVTFAVILWLLLMFKAYKKAYYKLPLIGQIAEKWNKKRF